MPAPNLIEELMALHLAELGVPYCRQYVYVPGRNFRADFALPSLRLLVEVQGGIYSRRAHGSITGVLADLKRGNEAAIAGWHVLRVTPDEVSDGRALALVRRFIERETR